MDARPRFGALDRRARLRARCLRRFAPPNACTKCERPMGLFFFLLCTSLPLRTSRTKGKGEETGAARGLNAARPSQAEGRRVTRSREGGMSNFGERSADGSKRRRWWTWAEREGGNGEHGSNGDEQNDGTGTGNGSSIGAGDGGGAGASNGGKGRSGRRGLGKSCGKDERRGLSFAVTGFVRQCPQSWVAAGRRAPGPFRRRPRAPRALRPGKLPGIRRPRPCRGRRAA